MTAALASEMRVLVLLVAACSGHSEPVSIDGAMASSGDAAAADAAMPVTSMQLPIPPRQQWTNANGYCGETSIQSIALYDGAWISQKIVRQLAGGELLLGVNEEVALNALHLAHVTWDSSAAQPQASAFLAWIETELLHGAPVVYGVYLTDAANDPDYDHIVPAVGVTPDQLTSNDNYDDQITVPLATLAATRSGCMRSTVQGGCVPRDVDYGVAITGVMDAQHASLPVSMTVTVDPEPNVSTGAHAIAMTGTITASGLVAGHSYALLRFDGYAQLPADPTPAQLLAAASKRTDFTATAASWTGSDTFQSDSATYFRCVAL